MRVASARLLLCVLAPAVAGETIKVKIPGQEVEASIEIPGFEPSERMKVEGRTLLAGKMENDAVISLLWEENFPYVSAADCPKPFAKERGFKTFDIDDKICIQYRLEVGEALCQSQFYACLPTPDYLYTLHVSRTYPLKGAAGPKDLQRSEVESTVKSLAVTGQADRSSFKYPPEVYAFRDEAAKQASGQLEWVSKQCNARPEDWVPPFYLGELATNAREDEPARRGYVRASEILAKKAGRSVKETLALLVSVDARAAHFAGKKKFDQARPLCQQVLEIVHAGDPPELLRFREEALFNLACCSAMARRSDEAIQYLRQAIEARPTFKERAEKEDLLDSLKSKPEFKKLVAK